MSSTEISLREVYDVLLEVRDDVTAMKVSMNDVTDDVKDHEKRIRSLERKVWVAAGFAAATGAGLSQALTQLFAA